MKRLQSVCRRSPIEESLNVGTPTMIAHEVEVESPRASLAHHIVRMGDRAHIAARFGKALLSYKRALKIFESDRECDPVEVVACLNKISEVCREQGLSRKLGYLDIAETLYVRANDNFVAVLEEPLGDGHARVRGVIKNLAELYTRMGRPREAFRWESKVFESSGHEGFAQ